MRKAILYGTFLALVLCGGVVIFQTQNALVACPCMEDCGGGSTMPCVVCCGRACPWFTNPWAKRFGLGCRANHRGGK